MSIKPSNDFTPDYKVNFLGVQYHFNLEFYTHDQPTPDTIIQIYWPEDKYLDLPQGQKALISDTIVYNIQQAKEAIGGWPTEYNPCGIKITVI